MRKQEKKRNVDIARKSGKETQSTAVSTPAESHYQYFQIDEIQKKLEFSGDALRKGQEYIASKAVNVESINVGYYEQTKEEGKDGNEV